MVQLNQSVHFRALGTTYKVLSESVGGSAAIIEHTLEAKSLGAPMHKHTRETKFLLEGELSVFKLKFKPQDRTFIVKPMGIFHTFGMQAIKWFAFLK